MLVPLCIMSVDALKELGIIHALPKHYGSQDVINSIPEKDTADA